MSQQKKGLDSSSFAYSYIIDGNYAQKYNQKRDAIKR